MGIWRHISDRLRRTATRQAPNFATRNSPQPLDLAGYRELFSPLEPPAPHQLREFAKFVTGAHSWYKHLPLQPPGAPLQFFLDPAAGLQLEVTPTGRLRATPRAERGFHYSWLPTSEYRERFGHLAYSRSGGTSVSLVLGGGGSLIPSDDEALVCDPSSGTLYELPLDILEAGEAWMSGLAHTLGSYVLWRWNPIGPNRPLALPEESGGSRAATRIMQRCSELRADPTRVETYSFEDHGPGDDPNLTSVDVQLHELLRPERERQIAGMVAAMQRVVALVWPGAV
jgi:hypothetical protein